MGTRSKESEESETVYSHGIVVFALNQQRVCVCSILFTVETQTTTLWSMPNIVHKHEVNTDQIKEARGRKCLIFPRCTSGKLMSRDGSNYSTLRLKVSDLHVIEI